ncbi:LysR substrate-binding domain-containing protein [Alteromonas antoniana]|uniref:LysR substrate-binding domain-containing protein n=1 Tax=Alteromonas antoniana TaxID=2803813 RepID=UPI001C45C5C9|nr:LysR substrate-binding domain-containing protein [Alteromonas antoniana]
MDKRLRWLNNLLCFEVAGRHQSYSRAAAELFISQAAVSQQMRQLESNLGVTLFTREARRMVLTEPGKTLFSACQRGFVEVINGLNQIQEAPLEGDLTVSSTQAFCALWLVPNLHSFASIHPDININVLSSNRIVDFNDGHVDLAIRFSTSTSQLQHPSLVIERIAENSVFPVCSPSFMEKYSLNTPEDFIGARLFGLTYEDKVNWESWFENADVDLTAITLKKTAYTSSDLALSAALAGQGVMLASDIMVGRYVQSGELTVPIDLPHPLRWKSHLVYSKFSPKGNRIKLFCDWIKAEMPFKTPVTSLDEWKARLRDTEAFLK